MLNTIRVFCLPSAIHQGEAGVFSSDIQDTMDKQQPQTYKDIDWQQLWQNAQGQKSWSSKGASDWDKKASSFAERTGASPYIPLFLSRLPLDRSFTILDVGAGPGTLSIPLAQHVHRVTALDYSQKMLEILDTRAHQEKLDNIRTVHCSWEDNWQEKEIEPHDIAIASRSMNVDDLGQAIRKICQYAKKYVFISDRIDPSPFDPEAFEAIGRDFNSGPDYIYTLNFLYTLGIHPHVEILELNRDTLYASMEEALMSYCWMFRDLTTDEQNKLKEYLHSKTVPHQGDGIVIHRQFPPKWALIWWQIREKS